MPTLPDTKPRVIINAGHWDKPETPNIEDPGAVKNGIIEQVECTKIRDEVVRLLRANQVTVYAVPDELSLAESIKWANKMAPHLNDALAIDIHLNYLSNTTARGTETFHGTSTTSKKVADVFAEEVAKSMGIPNRGAKPDTQTAVGSLGWIRKTTMWATLVEVCFLSNPADMEVLRGTDGYTKAARGIVNAIMRVLGIDVPDNETVRELLDKAESRNRDAIQLVQQVKAALQ